jgi:hypothetical protein
VAEDKGSLYDEVADTALGEIMDVRAAHPD